MHIICTRHDVTVIHEGMCGTSDDERVDEGARTDVQMKVLMSELCPGGVQAGCGRWWLEGSELDSMYQGRSRHVVDARRSGKFRRTLPLHSS